MSILRSGLETLGGAGNVAANAIFDADQEKLDAMMREFVPIPIPGVAQVMTILVIEFDYDVWPEAIIINANFIKPASGPLTVQCSWNDDSGPPVAKTFSGSLTATNSYVKVVNSDTVAFMPKGNQLTIAITAADGTCDSPQIMVQLAKRNLGA